MSSAILGEILEDAQTTVTSLGGAVAGATAQRLGDLAIISFKIPTGPGAGDVGMRFLMRALVASTTYAGGSYLMPESSTNSLWSTLFFASNPALVREATTLASLLVNSIIGFSTLPPPQKGKPVTPYEQVYGRAECETGCGRR